MSDTKGLINIIHLNVMLVSVEFDNFGDIEVNTDDFVNRGQPAIQRKWFVVSTYLNGNKLLENFENRLLGFWPLDMAVLVDLVGVGRIDKGIDGHNYESLEHLCRPCPP